MVVLAAVQQLPPRQRMSIVLRYYLDLPEADVAQLMRCSTGTVKSQVAKAKVALAAALGPQTPTTPLTPVTPVTPVTPTIPASEGGTT